MATTNFLGRLGDRNGINVARVEVSMWKEEPTDPEYNGPIGVSHILTASGYYLVHARGDEPEMGEGEDATIYNVFEELVHRSMQAKVENGAYDGYEIEDVSST